MLPPAGEQKPEDTQICREPDTEVTGPPEAEGRGVGGWRNSSPAWREV